MPLLAPWLSLGAACGFAAYGRTAPASWKESSWILRVVYIALNWSASVALQCSCVFRRRLVLWRSARRGARIPARTCPPVRARAVTQGHVGEPARRGDPTRSAAKSDVRVGRGARMRGRSHRRLSASRPPRRQVEDLTPAAPRKETASIPIFSSSSSTSLRSPASSELHARLSSLAASFLSPPVRSSPAANIMWRRSSSLRPRSNQALSLLALDSSMASGDA